MAEPPDRLHPRAPEAALPGRGLYDDGFDMSARRQRLDALGVALIVPLATAGAHVVAWARQHWLLLFNLGNAILFLGTFVSPLLGKLGWATAAQSSFDIYHILCLQRPTHSFFLWGYQLGMEERMVAFPAAQLCAGVGYACVRARRALRPLNAWFFLAWSVPLLFDIFSQSVGGRESDWVWRVSTGALFGVVSVWLFYPLLAWAGAPANRTGKVKLRLDGSWHL